MIRKLLLLIICLSLNLVKGQEENTNYGVLPTDIPTHNLIRYNRFYFNPTFSLVRENRKSINAYNKVQWAGFNDNPQTYLLNYTSNFDEKIGVALGLHQQNEGIYRYFGGIANFAYNLELNDDMNFTFGINLGFSQSGIKSNIDSATSTVLNSGVQVDDPVLLNFENSSSFQLTPGVNFNYTDFDIGVSVVNLVAYNLSASELQTDNMAFNGHIMYTTTIGGRRSDKTIRGMGYANMISDANSDSRLRYGGSAILDLPKLGWAQAGYNSFYGVSLGIGGNVTSTVSIGYNYEMGLGDTSNFGSTHEITLAYNFATEQKTRRGRKTSTQQKSYEARDSEIRRLKKEILQQNRLIRELQNNSGDSATQAQRSISRLEKQIQEAKEEEARQARQLALQREEEVKLLNKQTEEERLAAQKTLEMEMNEQEQKMAAQKKLEQEMAFQKAEEQRLASQKKLEMEMNEDTSAEETRIAAEEAAREEEAAKQQEEEDKRLAQEAEATRLAEEAEAARLAQEAEAARLAEEQRLAQEAEATRLAEEAEAARLAQETEAARLAEEQRLAQEAEAARLAEEQRLAQEAEAARLAEEAEATRLAEEQRRAEESRKKLELITNTQSVIANGTVEELRRQSELVRSSTFIPNEEKQNLLSEIAAKEAEAARLAEEQRLAQEAEAARLAEEQRLAQEAEAARLAEEQRLAQEAEAARLAEEQRLAQEAEAARLAEEQRLAQEAEAARLAEEQRLAQEAEAARLAEEQRLAQEAEAARLAEEQRLAQEAEAERLAEEQRLAQEAAAAEAARLAAEAAKATEVKEEGLEEIQKELDNSSRISSKIFARRDSLLTTSLNVDKREFSKLLESLVNMDADAEDAKNDSDPTSSKRLSAKNRFIKFAEASRPQAQYATKYIPGYPEGYYLIGNVFKGGEYANKFTNSLKDLGFNDSQIILNPENNFQYVSIENYDTKEEAAEKYLNNIDNRFYGDMWILHIAKSRVASYKKLLQETRLIKDTVKDDTVVSETLSYIGGHNIQNGYYLITSIFKRENYFERGMERLKSKGLEPQYFRNPKDNYIYVYLKRFDNLDDAKQSLFSNVNNTYDGELYILKIQ